MSVVTPRDLLIAPKSESALSFWDCLAGLAGGAEVALLHAKAFWPELVEVEEYVFIAENYDADYFARTLAAGGEATVEATINTTYLESMFGAAEAECEVFEALGQTLCESWVACARGRFPGREFVAHFAWYSTDGDPGIVLHQARWICAQCEQDAERL